MVGIPGCSKGCHECRKRKIKCDGTRPGCNICQSSGLPCSGYKRDLKKVISKSGHSSAKIPSEAELDALEAALKSPERIVGYRGYSRMISASRNFFVARQYTTLNARVILMMQDDIAESEDELNRLERRLSLFDPKQSVQNGSFRNETSAKRLEILASLKFRLKEYNEYINSYSQVGTRGQVTARDIQSLANWHDLYEGAISAPEVDYLNHKDDLIYVTPTSDSSLRRAFGYVAPKFKLTWFRRKPDDLEMGYEEPILMIWDEERAQAFFTRATMIVGLLMLIGPLWVLEFVNGPLERLATISGFVILFLILLSVATTARTIESLAGAAGYAAVLMVFLQVPSLGSP